MNRQKTLSPILFPSEIKSLNLLLKYYETVKEVVDNGGSIQQIQRQLKCRYSEAAEILAAVAVLKNKFQ